jgi:hypothetical protein
MCSQLLALLSIHLENDVIQNQFSDAQVLFYKQLTFSEVKIEIFLLISTV